VISLLMPSLPRSKGSFLEEKNRTACPTTRLPLSLELDGELKELYELLNSDDSLTIEHFLRDQQIT